MTKIIALLLLLDLIAVDEGGEDYDTYEREKIVDVADEEEYFRKKKSFGDLYYFEQDIVRHLKQRLSKIPASIFRDRERELEGKIKDDPRVLGILLKWRDEYEKEIEEKIENERGYYRLSSTTELSKEFDMKKNMLDFFGIKYDDVVNEIAEEQTCEAACQNGGTCQLEDIKLFSCLCVDGFTGEFCQYDVNECELRDFIPCKADKKCINTLGSYYCTCRRGFSIQDGGFCRAFVTCDQISCENGGECAENDNDVDGWVCECPLGFKGDLCEIELRGCSGDPCPPNLTCVATDAKEADHACVPRPAEREAELFLELDLSSDLVFCLSLASVVCILGGFSVYRRCHKKKNVSLNESSRELELEEDCSV